MMLTLALGALLAQGYYTPQEAQALFLEANDAYYREDYAAARAGYQRLIERGYAGPDVLFNLGTTSLAAGQLGEAVLQLERARRARGNAEDIEANLAVARARQLDKVVGERAEEPFLERLARATPERFTSGLFLASWLLGFGLIVLARLLAPGRRALVAVLASLSFTLAAGSGALVAAHAYVTRTVAEGVVVAEELQAREAPQQAARISFEVHAGLKVRLVESSGRFVRIRLPNGLEGWAEKEGVAEI